MDDGNHGVADLPNDADWVTIPSDSEAWSGPVQLPPPIADPATPQLNTHEMDWESFERLVLAITRVIDGAYEARRYGRAGQTQHGLDVVAFFTGRPASVYQAKRWQVFRAADLSKAVEGFLQGVRPFDATRLVIAVASETRDDKTLEKLWELRQAHGDVQIELWDRQVISDYLRNQPQPVTTFFGSATAAAFCTNMSTAPTQGPIATSVAADAILRGPIAHLELADDFLAAKRLLDKHPGDAAEMLGAVADRLEESGFLPHAVAVRDQEAKALRAAGRGLEESRIRLDLGWRQLDAGDAFSAGLQVRQIAEWTEATDVVVRSTNALSAAVGLRREYAVTLDQLVKAVDALVEGDPHRIDATLLLAEEAVVERRGELVEARAESIKEVADAVPRNFGGHLIAARLRMCVADTVGGWEELVETARDTFPPAVTALVLARFARHLALLSQPAPSVARWRDAIERACTQELNDDAADWLYSLRTVRLQHGMLDGDIDDLHRHAQLLRAAGSGTLLPEPYRAYEQGLAALRDERLPEALGALRRYLWRSTVGADWTGEIEAHALLGDLFVRTSRVPEAVQHYVLAGRGKKLAMLGASLEDEPIRLPTSMLTPRPWERAAAFSFAASSADLIVDEDALEWCSAAFGEVIDHPVRAPAFAPNPWLEAFKAFGALAVLSTEDQAERFLALGWELIPRDPGTSRYSDEAQVQALTDVARAHPRLRVRAVDQLLQALLLDQRMGEMTLGLGHDLLRLDPERTAAAVGSAAAAGSVEAALALVAAEGDTSQAVTVAREHLESAVAPRVHEPGVQTFGTGLPQAAALITVLPEQDRIRFAKAMVDYARDTRESRLNRYEALLAIQGVARYLPSADRDELFDSCLPFAEGRHEADGGSFPARDDPLAWFRFSLGAESLAPAGLMAVAALAHSPTQHKLVEKAAVAQLGGADDSTANSIAVALAALPPDQLTLPLELLAAHPSPWIRTLAAVVWAQRPDEPEELGVRLARDPSVHVRRSLGEHLGKQRHEGIQVILAEDARRSVRRLVTAE